MSDLVIKGMELPKMICGEPGYVDVRIFADGSVIMAKAAPPYYQRFEAVQIRSQKRALDNGRSPNPNFVPPPTKRKRKYFRKCGVCGERYEQSDMIRTDNSPNGWICHECVLREHPEYESEEF